MSSTPCHLYDDGKLYAIPEEHVALRARWPFPVRGADRLRVLQQGVHGLVFNDIKPTHCAIILFDVGGGAVPEFHLNIQYWYEETNAILNLQPQQEEISGLARSPAPAL